MRHLASVFIITTTPFVVFLATVLYGGITPQLIKTQLSQSQIYDRLPQLLTDQSLTDVPSDSESQAFLTMITSYADSAYIQAKTEALIDDMDAWITGKTDVAPVLSFKDIQEKVMTDNPELHEMIRMGAEELGKNSGKEESFDLMKQSEISVGENLKFLKDGYFAAKIALPVLAILLLGSLIFIVVKTHGWKGRFRYVGIVLIIAAIVGYVHVITGSILLAQVLTVISSQTNGMIQLITPIISGLSNAVVSQYNLVQAYVSIILAVVGSLMLIGSFIIHTAKGKMVVRTIKK